MYWQEDTPPKTPTIPSTLTDFAYRIQCPHLPLDHAYALSTAIQQALPWLADLPAAGIHLIHGAESGNGWSRPQDNPQAWLHLSRRTRLVLRLPHTHLEAAKQLTGQTLMIDGHALQVGTASIKPLVSSTTLFSRYVIGPEAETAEAAWITELVQQLRTLGISVRKILSGKPHKLQMPTHTLYTRSVMIADLTPDESIILQHQGLGAGRKTGCGLFIPYKGITAVNASE